MSTERERSVDEEKLVRTSMLEQALRGDLDEGGSGIGLESANFLARLKIAREISEGGSRYDKGDLRRVERAAQMVLSFACDSGRTPRPRSLGEGLLVLNYRLAKKVAEKRVPSMTWDILYSMGEVERECRKRGLVTREGDTDAFCPDPKVLAREIIDKDWLVETPSES